MNGVGWLICERAWRTWPVDARMTDLIVVEPVDRCRPLSVACDGDHWAGGHGMPGWQAGGQAWLGIAASCGMAGAAWWYEPNMVFLVWYQYLKMVRICCRRRDLLSNSRLTNLDPTSLHISDLGTWRTCFYLFIFIIFLSSLYKMAYIFLLVSSSATSIMSTIK